MKKVNRRDFIKSASLAALGGFCLGCGSSEPSIVEINTLRGVVLEKWVTYERSTQKLNFLVQTEEKNLPYHIAFIQDAPIYKNKIQKDDIIEFTGSMEEVSQIEIQNLGKIACRNLYFVDILNYSSQNL